MRIIFNLLYVGLGNNGGSRTLIKCAETLKKLGYDTYLLCEFNKYTWGNIEVPIIDKMIDGDVIIATGYNSVKSTLKSKIKRKYYYIRGFESWVTTKNNLIRSFKEFEPMHCIVNSEWLLHFMNDHNISSKLLYPGLDYGDFFVQKTFRDNIIGGLYSSKHKTKKHDDLYKISELTGYPLALLNKDIQDANSTELRKFYNNIKVWISTSELEGLHNCPMEAALCGCAIVSTDHPRNGTSDYAINQQTCLTYPAGDLNAAALCCTNIINNDHLRYNLIINMNEIITRKIGDRETNMKRFGDYVSM